MSDPSAERWILCCDEEQIQLAEKGNAEEGIGILRCPSWKKTTAVRTPSAARGKNSFSIGEPAV